MESGDLLSLKQPGAMIELSGKVLASQYKNKLKLKKHKPEVVAHPCNPSTGS
jgi:hypothetical protein